MSVNYFSQNYKLLFFVFACYWQLKIGKSLFVSRFCHFFFVYYKPKMERYLQYA